MEQDWLTSKMTENTLKNGFQKRTGTRTRPSREMLMVELMRTLLRDSLSEIMFAVFQVCLLSFGIDSDSRERCECPCLSQGPVLWLCHMIVIYSPPRLYSDERECIKNKSKSRGMDSRLSKANEEPL